MSPVRVAIAGSSGSIGTQTLDVVRAEAGAYEVVALGVGSSVDALIAQAHEFRPAVVGVADPAQRARVAAELPFAEVVADLADLVEPADVVVNAVVGFAGLPVTVATLRAGKRLALANKESLIAAGPVVQPLRATPGAELVPVDSEHCAVHQCLRSSVAVDREVARVVLTASGGPFRTKPREALATVTPAEALAHPTWSMGPKITIDSATMMNKALEIIEARWLFDMPAEKIAVLVHPQSIVHSMVEFVDGSVIAQLSPPDMRLPIQYALTYPERTEGPARKFDFTRPMTLEFEPPDVERFPAVRLGHEAAARGGTAGAVLNAANEAAVGRFLAGGLRFTDIAEACARVLDEHPFEAEPTLDEILRLDSWARQEVATWSGC